MMITVSDIFQKIDYGPAPESEKIAEAWLDSRNRTIDLFIAGKQCVPKKGKYFDSINPATGLFISKIAQATEVDIDLAVKSAMKALPAWKDHTGHDRARKLYSLARLVQKHARLLAVLETLDNGKPIRETRDIDIPLVARHFYYHAGWAQLLEQRFSDYDSVGVVGQIIPWNFPLLMLAWKVAPALATGCTVILKPAEFTSITAIAFSELCNQAGIPPGVINIVTGDASTGEHLVRHPQINKIAFTGSTEVGKKIRSLTAGTGKSLTLELGGKSPFIVFDDADIDSAIEGVVDAIWFNQGQVCCAGSRLLLQESIAKKFIDKLKKRMKTLRIGNPLDKAIDIGAIVAPIQLNKIIKLVDQAAEDGANIWQVDWTEPTEGYFFPPTLITDVHPASLVCQVEIFGPVIVSMNFRTPADAIALANNTNYGLAASIWTENINLALDIAPQIKAGVVWTNSTNLFDAASGFGGYKESGFGREGGQEGINAYLKPKFLTHLPKYDDPDDKKTDFSKIANKRRNVDGIDRTAKQYIDGKQKRSDSGYSRSVFDSRGGFLGDVGDGNRKDIRDGVEAAIKAQTWSQKSAHNRAQILYYIAENLEIRSEEFKDKIVTMTGKSIHDAKLEIDTSLSRLFSYAAWADKYDGQVHSTPVRNVTLAMKEPIGVIGIACPDELPLLGFISLVAPAVCVGNRVIVIPSEHSPLIATDFYQVLDTSDVPGGVINIVTGERDTLMQTLAEHNSVDAVWYFGPLRGSEIVEKASAGNMKQTWVNYGKRFDFLDAKRGEGEYFLQHATQVKNIWVPYGE